MAAITSAVIGAGTAGYQILSAEKAKKDAKEALDEFERAPRTNPYKNIQLSTEGTENRTDNQLSAFATAADALQRSGVRGVVGGIPRLSEGNILVANQNAESLDQQNAQRSQLIARGEENIQNEQSRQDDLIVQGLGQQLQTARQDSASGIINLISSGLALGSAINNPLTGGSGGGGGGGTGGGGTANSSAAPNGGIPETVASTIQPADYIPQNLNITGDLFPSNTIDNDDLFNTIFGTGANQRPSFF